MLARIVVIAGIGGPAAVASALSPFFERAGWRAANSTFGNIDALFPWWGWLIGSFAVAFLWLLLMIARRAKATEDELRRDVLNKQKEMTVHDFFRYVGIQIGDVSNEGMKQAEMALEHLEMCALAGDIKLWGVSSRQGFHGVSQLIPKEHWRTAFIYPGNAIEDRPDLPNYILGIKTTPRDTNLVLGAVENRPELFDHLYISRAAVRREFRKNEYKSKHAPSFREYGNGTR